MVPAATVAQGSFVRMSGSAARTGLRVAEHVDMLLLSHGLVKQDKEIPCSVFPCCVLHTAAPRPAPALPLAKWWCHEILLAIGGRAGGSPVVLETCSCFLLLIPMVNRQCHQVCLPAGRSPVLLKKGQHQSCCPWRNASQMDRKVVQKCSPPVPPAAHA